MTHLAFELRTNTPGSLLPALAEQVEASGYRSLWVNHPPDEDGIGCLAAMAAATARITLGTAVVPISAVPPDAILRRIDAVLLSTVTPDLARAAAEEIREQATVAGRPVPGVYVNVMAGVGAAQLAELEGSAEFLKQLPAYAAHFRRTGVSPEQTSIAAGGLGELPRLLEPWRDTVDEVVLVPVRADEAGPARDLVDAAIADF
jgi:alkanesulfonate monooxygenase SsuD/methylene tetrahydromethanopterin reductase-like flavin-dependent oxidoreductase (luciferase family)